MRGKGDIRWWTYGEVRKLGHIARHEMLTGLCPG
jgi:hypothetical protein